MKWHFRKAALAFFVAFAPLFLAACGAATSSSSGGATSTGASTGTFVDAPVQGVHFSTASQSGLTDANGNFTYKPGETVTFSIGNTILGSASANAKVTVVDLVSGFQDEMNPTVINIARLLQSLDANQGAGSVLVITQAARDALTSGNVQLDVTKSEANFAADSTLGSVLTTLGVSLVSTQTATAHLLANILKIKAPGTYSGTYYSQYGSTYDSGNATMTIAADGAVTGHYDSVVHAGQTWSFNGTMNADFSDGTGTTTNSSGASDGSFEIPLNSLDGVANGFYNRSNDAGWLSLRKN